MPKTYRDALKQKRRFEKKYPKLRCIIVNDTKKFSKRDGLRYNFRFTRR